MYINGKWIDEDTLIYYDNSNGEMVDILSITVKELLDTHYLRWKDRVKHISMNATEKDFIEDWMTLNYATFVPYP